MSGFGVFTLRANIGQRQAISLIPPVRIYVYGACERDKHQRTLKRWAERGSWRRYSHMSSYACLFLEKLDAFKNICFESVW
jgi:hypothetical protein